MRPPAQFTTVHHSVDELAETSGFELDFCQLDPGTPIIKTTATRLHSLICTRFEFSKALHQQGVSPDGVASFGYMLGNSQSRWGGRNADANDLVNFNSRCGFETISRGEFIAESIHLNQNRLYRMAETLGVDISNANPVDFAQPQVVTADRMRRLKNAVKRAKLSLRASPLRSAATGNVLAAEEAVYRAVINCLEVAQPKCSITRSNRLLVLRRAIEFIKSNARETNTVTDICSATATSTRTLERVFREELDVTPKQYSKFIKLMGVQQELRQRDTEQNIKDIAISWGFWHMGQFAWDYKQYFGYLPSETSIAPV